MPITTRSETAPTEVSYKDTPAESLDLAMSVSRNEFIRVFDGIFANLVNMDISNLDSLEFYMWYRLAIGLASGGDEMVSKLLELFEAMSALPLLQNITAKILISADEDFGTLLMLAIRNKSPYAERIIDLTLKSNLTDIQKKGILNTRDSKGTTLLMLAVERMPQLVPNILQLMEGLPEQACREFLIAPRKSDWLTPMDIAASDSPSAIGPLLRASCLQSGKSLTIQMLAGITKRKGRNPLAVLLFNNPLHGDALPSLVRELKNMPVESSRDIIKEAMPGLDYAIRRRIHSLPITDFYPLIRLCDDAMLAQIILNTLQDARGSEVKTAHIIAEWDRAISHPGPEVSDALNAGRDTLTGIDKVPPLAEKKPLTYSVVNPGYLMWASPSREVRAQKERQEAMAATSDNIFQL